MPRNDAKRTNEENTNRLPIVVKNTQKNKKRKNKNITKNNTRNTTLEKQQEQQQNEQQQQQQQNEQQQQQQEPQQQQEQPQQEEELISNKTNGTSESCTVINQTSGCGGGGDSTCNANSEETPKTASKRRRQFSNTNDFNDSINNNNNSLITNNRKYIKTEETTASTSLAVSFSLISSSPSSYQENYHPYHRHLHHHYHHHHHRHYHTDYQQHSSRHHHLSTLYPIVIETHISETQNSLPGDLNKTITTTTAATTATTAAITITTATVTAAATSSSSPTITTSTTSTAALTAAAAAPTATTTTATTTAVAVTTTTATVTTTTATTAGISTTTVVPSNTKAEISEAPATTKHSTSLNVADCNTKETPATTTTTTETTTLSTALIVAAVDTLLEHPKHQQKFQKKNVAEQRNHRKQQLRGFHHTQEVKARLATLRARKVIVANDNKSPQKEQNNHAEQKEEVKKNTFEKNPIVVEITSQREQNISGTGKDTTLENEDSAKPTFYKRAFPQQFDEATLNRIETLSDNDVKKPNNRRKRNQTAALLLGFSSHPVRSKRLAASAAAASIQTAVSVPAATGDSTSSTNNKHNKQTTTAPLETLESKETRRQFTFSKPLSGETVNTISKKRARIMSLYERPFQATNDGRGGGGSVVGNGYMSTSRSSSSGGGGSGGALIMSDSNDSQELGNQYYISGTSNSNIAGNSSSAALLGNGSAINHAPTMGTLCNIGNTCYLNSVVYTLRFAPQFLHNLHHLLADLNALQQNIARARAKSSSLGRGNSAVHMENARSWSSKDLASMEQYTTNTASGVPNVTATSAVPGSASAAAASTALTQFTQKSSHQVLTEKLHDLYQSLYRNEMSESTEPHHADTLLHAIQDVSTIFEGNQQQDAHEFLMCVLNSIRETSQTLLKAIAECPDVILNGYIANPDDNERDLKHSNLIASGSGGGLVGGSSNTTAGNMSVSSALSSFTSNSKSSLFFSRKSKRKDETKNSKNTRLQSPLKDNQIPSGNLTTQSNSLFYLNANDLNSSSASSTSPPSVSGGGGIGSIASPFNSTTAAGGSEEVDNSSSLALLLKDKQRLECKIRELGLDFFNEDFEGITVSTTKCLSCETITEQKETMIDIAVPVPQAGYESNEFTDRPSSFIQNSCITREYFRNENKYRCEQCCGYTEAIRSISYEVLPRLLIIQLSRFSGGMEKINSYIPTSFTLQCFCSKCCELSDANKLHIYKLYSVITHVGATMSVGHYIAYTCSLDWANEYINCPKEQRRRASQERAAVAAAAANGGGNGTTLGQLGTAVGNQSTSSSATNAIGLGSTTSSSSSTKSFMKIMNFGRNKTSSSGDMSKNVKHINGLTSSSKAITNGIGKLTMNNSGSSGTSNTSQCSSTTCQSINCCAMRLTAQQQLHYLHTTQTNASDLSENDPASGYSSSSNYNNTNYNNNMQQPYTTSSGGGSVGGIGTSSGYGSTGRGATKASYASQNHNGSEPIWYMCDDDKIKAMTQREFEELLSPARKITITPYLLFYARYNLQTSTPPKSSSATMSSSSPGPMTSSPQASWSNESLQSSGHSAHSSGMRM